MPVKRELVREIAERIDDGRRVNMRNLSRELNVPVEELRAAYRELARQRGGNPLLDRARGYNAESRRIAAGKRGARELATDERHCLHMAGDVELVREIADRIDDGRRVHLGILSRELNVPREDLRAAYRELARRRGGDPLLDRVRRRLEAVRQAGVRVR